MATHGQQLIKTDEGINVFSMFDGISCGQIALEREGIKVNNYYACEIKKEAIEVTQSNYPGTIQLGDVTKVDLSVLPKIDLVIFGSPCQDLSQAHKVREGLEGKKSSLFYVALDILNILKPKYFFMENVMMKEVDYRKISDLLGVEGIKINSKLVSGALRSRYYWTNIPNVVAPLDKGITLQSVLTTGYTDRIKARALLVSDSRPLATPALMWHRNKKFSTLVFDSPDCDWTKGIRYLNQTELERLQTVPEGYTKLLTRNKAANVLGDCWTVDVVAHIFKQMVSTK
jgi:DNA (cytosine-5)-methyltransferase 3A